MGITRFFVAFLTACTLLVNPVCGADKKPQAPLVVVTAVVEQPARPNRAIPGTVIPLLEATIASRISGYVVQTPIQVGDRVEKGDKLIILDSMDSKREKQIQLSIIAEAKANLTHARSNLARDRKLQNTPALSRQRLSDRITEEAVSAAKLDRANAQLKQIDDRLSRHEIIAPFSGIITEKLIQKGEWLEAGQGVVTLLDPTQLEIKVLIPANIAATLQTGATAESFFPKVATTSMVSLRSILPRQNPQSRNQPSFWTMSNSTKAVAGEEVSLTIPLGLKKKILLVAKDAIIRNGKQNMVFVVDDDTIRGANVQLGPSINGFFQVKKGLKAGEFVVVRGNERVRPGQKVTSIPLTGASPPTPIVEKKL
ncbi:MAG: efflux RND transporter periplasmic adaptor subunit [Magnetococcales bacterium]|nr:efflux RND transporter periplasmic adaptor subunit [Magnetococcales bacterium]